MPGEEGLGIERAEAVGAGLANNDVGKRASAIVNWRMALLSPTATVPAAEQSISSNVDNKLAEMLPTLCPSTSNVFERAMFFENYNFVNLCSLLKVQTSVRWATPARLAGATIFSAAQGVSSTMRCRRAGAADPPAIARRSAWSEMPSKGALCCLPTKTGVEMRKPGRSKTGE